MLVVYCSPVNGFFFGFNLSSHEIHYSDLPSQL